MKFAAMFYVDRVITPPIDDRPFYEGLGAVFAFEIDAPEAVLTSVGWLAETEDGLMNIFYAWRRGYLQGQESNKYFIGKEDLTNVEIILAAIEQNVDR